MYNFLDQSLRKSIIDEIVNPENRQRKDEHKKRKDVYNDKQHQYVLKMLSREFPNSIADMRVCSSINLTKRIVQEQSSIYKQCPERLVTLEGGSELNDQQQAQIDALYEEAEVDSILKVANQKYKLHDQCAIKVVPKDGCLDVCVLDPSQYDVVPNPENPEEALAVIISNYNRQNLNSANQGLVDIQGNYAGSKNLVPSNNYNETIADEDDWKTSARFVWWTEEFNFITDGYGKITSDPNAIENPIKELPFIDVAKNKDFEYFVQRGSSTVAFHLDFLVTLSDNCNTNRLQSYAQPVISAEQQPQDIKVGPNNILFLKLNPERPEMKPSFEFASPQPDLKASLDLQDRLLSYFLTASGIDPKTVSGIADSQKYTSGIDRLLAMIDRFEASQDDIELFKEVECDLLELMVKWSNALQGTDLLEPSLQLSVLPDPENLELSVKFAKPTMTMSESEKEDSVIKRMEAGLISRTEAIAELRNVSDEQAQEIVKKIDQEMFTVNKIDTTNTMGA